MGPACMSHVDDVGQRIHFRIMRINKLSPPPSPMKNEKKSNNDVAPPPDFI